MKDIVSIIRVYPPRVGNLSISVAERCLGFFFSQMRCYDMQCLGTDRSSQCISEGE